MEKPLYPSPYMRITQGYMTGSHAGSYAIDEAGMDTGIDHIYAPFTGIIKKIYASGSNEVWLESIDKVEYPDGTVDYMTILFCHDNDVGNLFVGKIVKKGEIFYQEGKKGNATGNHCHIECGRGKFSGSGWHKNSQGYWCINNGKKPEDCLWIDKSIKILNSNGYIFRLIKDEAIDDDDNSEEIVIPEKPNDSTDKELKLIFTAPYDDLYAIELKKGQKLYLEK